MKLKKRVLVIGGGFGGIAATKALAHVPVHVTLLDRSNHYLFQPLLYQVAMAGLAPNEIASPIRSVLRHVDNARVLLAEVTSIDLAERRVFTRECTALDYDYLVLAPGAVNSYFGHEDWPHVAPGLKDLDDAVEIRRRVLLAFEAAEREPDPTAQRQHLTFVVIGGGPTGVELAGAIAELATFVLARDFRAIKPDATRVVLIEGGPRVLATFAPELSERATQSLHEMGVEVRVDARVTAIDEQGVAIGDARIDASTVLWAAGVRASPLCEHLGLPVDRSGRVKVEADCSVPGRPEVFVIGDAANFTPAGGSEPLPGVSPVAMQQGRFVARMIERSIEKRERGAFVYLDKGSMATIGRRRAVASVGRLHLSGFIAWLAWLTVHIFYLIDFRNRVVVLFDWAWSYFTYQRGSRLITGHRTEAGAPVRAVASAPIESGGPSGGHRLELHGEPLKLSANSGRVGAE
ncbi:MAG TPA: NAD(P)/FAD-dependent oxidoreductase [Polyangiaceae bacterium]|jgi:NADH dehydrogenase|nr:NAD(P)/FAD-dependent oxidoreductase [Polyangiaceae bacterium]